MLKVVTDFAGFHLCLSVLAGRGWREDRVCGLAASIMESPHFYNVWIDDFWERVDLWGSFSKCLKL